MNHKQRVQTPMGPGAVIGFERFQPNGWPDRPTRDDPDDGCRVIVELDDPTRWRPTQMTPHPYFSRREVTPL